MKPEAILAAIIPVVLKENQEIVSIGGDFKATHGMDMYELAATMTKKFIEAYENLPCKNSAMEKITSRKCWNLVSMMLCR